MKNFHVYIMTNKPDGVLYIGVTSNLPKRGWEHKNKPIKGFTYTYNLDKLVYYEACPDAEQAILREKRLKKWNRNWKIKLIEDMNPQWRDLYNEII